MLLGVHGLKLGLREVRERNLCEQIRQSGFVPLGPHPPASADRTKDEKLILSHNL